ncbi:MAG: hypothetical protein GY801_52750 [bacterium]|nr:hypothetical protein [bacterium]
MKGNKQDASSPNNSSDARDRGKLEYICNATGSVGKFLSKEIVNSGIPVTNWGDVTVQSPPFVKLLCREL